MDRWKLMFVKVNSKPVVCGLLLPTNTNYRTIHEEINYQL